ncbi:MAG TPA: hypothetical protein VH678_20585 [Xanthobacteraceae bacterium]|jgi:hypothetical protein
MPFERLAVLEEKVRCIETTLKDVSVEVHEIHDLLMKARGARWLVAAAASIAGFCSGVVAVTATIVNKIATH